MSFHVCRSLHACSHAHGFKIFTLTTDNVETESAFSGLGFGNTNAKPFQTLSLIGPHPPIYYYFLDRVIHKPQYSSATGCIIAFLLNGDLFKYAWNKVLYVVSLRVRPCPMGHAKKWGPHFFSRVPIFFCMSAFFFVSHWERDAPFKGAWLN